MKNLDFGRSALGASIAALMLAGCGVSQPPVGTPGAMSQFGNAHTTSSGNALLYIAKTGQDYGTLILNYPAGMEVNRITLKLPGFRGHFPLCGEGSTNGQETSSCLPLGVPG